MQVGRGIREVRDTQKHGQRDKVRFHLRDSSRFYCLKYLGTQGLLAHPMPPAAGGLKTCCGALDPWSCEPPSGLNEALNGSSGEASCWEMGRQAVPPAVLLAPGHHRRRVVSTPHIPPPPHRGDSLAAVWSPNPELCSNQELRSPEPQAPLGPTLGVWGMAQ